jgi:hypothetical protein
MPRIRVYDAAVATWVILWLVIAVLVSNDVRGLTQLSDTVVTSSAALDQTARSLVTVQRTLDSIPFVPEIGDIEELRRRVARTAREARASGRASKEHVERLALLLGIAIAVAPTLPVIAIYLPLRRTWRRAGA